MRHQYLPTQRGGLGVHESDGSDKYSWVMKVIIAGGRNHRWSAQDRETLDRYWKSLPITEVVSGSAPGADTRGIEWAKAKGIPYTEFPANWNKHGRAAGPIRNEQMAKYADALIVFMRFAGSGTRSMIRIARRNNIPTYYE